MVRTQSQYFRSIAYLIINGSKVYICLHWLSSNSARQHILTAITKSVLNQYPTHVLDLWIITQNSFRMNTAVRQTFEPPKAVPYWSFPHNVPAWLPIKIQRLTKDESYLPSKKFNHLPNSHSRWEPVRIHDRICQGTVMSFTLLPYSQIDSPGLIPWSLKGMSS